MTSAEQIEIIIRLAAGALGGLAVGIEREWSGRKPGERPRFAGVRTFLLIGLLGSLSAVLIEYGMPAAGTTILIATTLLVVIAYAGAAYHGDRESTTEFAAILVIAAGTLAGSGHLAIASGMNAFVALVLVEKSRIHSFVFRLQSEDLTAGLRFAVLALVVLPLLPEGPYGPPPGLRPRELWALVLVFSGLSFAGLIARRAVGPGRGYILAGFIGGIVSSTLVALNFARESRVETAPRRALAIGVIAACTILLIRVAFLMFILNFAVATAALPYLAISFTAGLIVILLLKSKAETGDTVLGPEKNPLRLASAIQMVVIFQIALTALYWVQQRFGDAGVLITSGIAGLTDVDSLIFMIGRNQGLEVNLAVQAIIVGILANTVLKGALAISIGKGIFRIVTVVGLIVISALMLAAWFVLRVAPL